MGIINHDTFTTRHGIELTDSYLAFRNETISITKTIITPLPAQPFNPSVSTIVTPTEVPPPQTVYRVTAICRVYANLEARQNNKDFIDMIPLTIEVSTPEIASNMYEFMYSKLKERYPNNTNVLETA
jgi:hypothetical protein